MTTTVNQRTTNMEYIPGFGSAGDDYVIIDQTVYTSHGETIHALCQDVMLTTDQVTDQDHLGYTWLFDNKGTYTLTFSEDTVVFGNIFLSVPNAVLQMTSKVTVTGEIWPDGNLSVQGDSPLVAEKICFFSDVASPTQSLTLSPNATVSLVDVERYQLLLS